MAAVHLEHMLRAQMKRRTVCMNYQSRQTPITTVHSKFLAHTLQKNACVTEI